LEAFSVSLAEAIRDWFYLFRYIAVLALIMLPLPFIYLIMYLGSFALVGFFGIIVSVSIIGRRLKTGKWR